MYSCLVSSLVMRLLLGCRASAAMLLFFQFHGGLSERGSCVSFRFFVRDIIGICCDAQYRYELGQAFRSARGSLCSTRGGDALVLRMTGREARRSPR